MSDSDIKSADSVAQRRLVAELCNLGIENADIAKVILALKYFIHEAIADYIRVCFFEKNEILNEVDEVHRHHFAQSIGNLDITVRTSNCLRKANIKYVRELVQKSKEDLLNLKNFGRKSLKEVQTILAERGLTLNMQIGGYKRPTSSVDVNHQYNFDEELADWQCSARIKNCLANARVRYVGELVQFSEKDVLRSQNFGKKSLKVLKQLLAERNLTLGIKLDGWVPPNK